MHRQKTRSVAVVLAMAGVLVAGCTNSPPPEPGQQPAEDAPVSLPGSGLPSVTPQPAQMNRLGDDIAVRGKVEVIVEPSVDRPALDLTVQVLRMAGASEVVVREPGRRDEDATLRVRLGGRTSPMIVKGLQQMHYDAPWNMEPESYVLAASGGEDPALVMGSSDPAGSYYAAQTLRQITSPGRIAGVGVVDEPTMPYRGAIEGFYGPPWTHQERMDQLAFYGDMKLNTYIYAPKDDPYHREQWREPYPPEKLGEVQELIGQAHAHHVKFVYALSPGKSICYSDEADFQALIGKMQAMYDVGVRDFSLPLDDISYTSWNCAADEQAYGSPSKGAAGRAQADLLNRVQKEFVDAHPDVSPLQFVPTEYSDVEDSAYKTAIRQVLDPRVLVMWTGDGVIPSQITVEDAREAEQVWGRKVFLWDNYPVNDFDDSAGRLLLGPYGKRQNGLSEQLEGDVVNPMNQAAASKVAETGAADFAWNDEKFDPQRAWRAAAEYLAGDRFAGGEPSLTADPKTVDALMVFFDLNHMSPLASGKPWQAPAPELDRRLDSFEQRWASGDRDRALGELRAYAQSIADAPEAIRAGAAPDFVADSEPWLAATDHWGDALLSTVDALRARAGGDEAAARAGFDAAEQAAAQARSLRTDPAEVRPQGPILVADGVLDTFVRRAPNELT
ncbi:beta-N-acetylglucosaminidase domain-containing protein [Saccharopolyspora halophila]|uniref:Beta-N-acetylglucosaminidase domain-containing protein n=1 Tax=Saccharopolyspora halophila TaxID=405551 RepID=A0ABP5SS03_9PSEU